MSSRGCEGLAMFERSQSNRGDAEDAEERGGGERTKESFLSVSLLRAPPRLRGRFGSALLALLACAPSLAAGETRAGVWISAEEIARLPDSGPAWNELVTWAQKQLPPADIAARDS